MHLPDFTSLIAAATTFLVAVTAMLTELRHWWKK